MRTSLQALQMPGLAALSLLLAACGGGTDSSANDGQAYGLASTSVTTLALPEDTKAQPQYVQLEGCVVDAQWLSAAGAAVHVRTADGRGVGTAFTDARGVFMVTVPARADIVVATDWAGPGALALKTGSQSMSVAACLPSSL